MKLKRLTAVFDASVPEPKDAERVTFSLEVDATIGSLRGQEREANEAMRAALQGHGTTHTTEEVERAIRERAEAGFRLRAAISRAQVDAVTSKMIAQYHRVRSDPLSAFAYGKG